MAGLDGARRFDLHLHTTRSDGTLAPDELLAACAAQGLDVIAITDHDLATELPHGPRDIDGHRLHVIAGAEVSGTHDGVEYHLLVYFPAGVPDGFRTFCTTRCQERAERFDQSVGNLGLPGLPTADDEARCGQRAITRQHLAEALVAAGHAATVGEAFRRFADTRHGNVPNVSLPFVDAIRIAREAGGVTSWAHPPMGAVQRHLATFAAAGLHALEVYRPTTSGADRRKLRRLAAQHGLFVTGGSDWHGDRDGRLGLFFVERLDLLPFLAALAA